jgi:hypothetical protein
MSTLGPPSAGLLEPVEAATVGESAVVDDVVGVVGAGSAAEEVDESVALELDEESVATALKAAAGDTLMRQSAMDKSPPAHTDHQ